MSTTRVYGSILPYDPNWNKLYHSQLPFPHIIIDHFLPLELCSELNSAYDRVDWQTYRHYNEDKECSNTINLPDIIQGVINDLNSDEFLLYLESITGIKNLIADKQLGSGGVHQSKKGGFLNIHADFTVHPYHDDWHRRLNVLIYLNEHWNPNWGGSLELWSTDMKKCMQKISPIAGRCVIFSTSADSFHGHPEPLLCPEGVWRRSIALYYYTNDKVEGISTEYKARPDDGLFHSSMIYIDKILLRSFHKLKSKLHLKDHVITKLMNIMKK